MVHQAASPRVAFIDDQLRVVITAQGSVVERLIGRDALGHPMWGPVFTGDPDAERLKKVKGWKAIGDLLGLEPRQYRRVQSASRRGTDPLPVEYDPWDEPEGYAAALLAWKARNTRSARHYDLERAAVGRGRRAA